MSGKKKKVDFGVRPRAAKKGLPPDAEQGAGRGRATPPPPKTQPEMRPQKRLTLNLPAGLHTAFKGRCVVEGVTIQDKVRMLIERDLAPAGGEAAGLTQGARKSATTGSGQAVPGERGRSLQSADSGPNSHRFASVVRWAQPPTERIPAVLFEENPLQSHHRVANLGR
jgi:hypothetical protein